jgi:hypothetical protein
MPLVTLLDLEKVNQIMNQTNQAYNTDNNNKTNSNSNTLFANALLQQFQSQNSKLFSNNTLILNCIQANAAAAAAQLMQAQQNSENQKQINYSRYKTELCRQFIENGECKYGDKCQFAHGMHDLKDVNRHPKYKTDYCKTFHSKGFCPYGPRCHFIHELHEKYDPSIQNVSQGKSTKTKSQTESSNGEDNTLIDKQIEEIQNQLASSLFVSDELNQLNGGCEAIESSNHSSCSSGSSSPVTVSSSSYASTSNSASVSSCTSPVLNRAVKKPKNSCSIYDNKIKNLFDGACIDEQTSPLTPRTRSSTSSTSSACSSTSSSSFELEEISQHVQTAVKQLQQLAGPNKNLGPIGRPTVQSPSLAARSPSGIFDIERINNLLMQQTNNTNSNCNSKSRTFLADGHNNNFFNNHHKQQLQSTDSFNGSFNQFYNQQQTPQLDRQSSW